MKDRQSNNKRIAKNTLLLYLRSIFMLLIGLYTSRVTLQILGVDNYGIYNLVGGVVAMFSLIGGAMSSASQRFLTFALGKNDPSTLKKVFFTSVTLHFILGGIFIILLEAVGVWILKTQLDIPPDRMDAANWVLQFSILTSFISIISVPYDSLIVAHERMGAFAFISIVETILKLVIVYILTILTWDKLIVYGFLLTCVALVKRIVYLVYTNKNFEETRSFKFMIAPSLFKEMFSFAGWNLMGNAAAIFRNQGVDILLNMFFGVTVNAAKGICNQVQAAVFQFITNFQTAVTPQITKSVAQGDYTRTHELECQGAKFSFYLLTFLSVPILISIHEILDLWLYEVPMYTDVLIFWSFMVMLNESLNRFLINAIMATGKIKTYQIVVAGTKLLVLPITYVVLLCGGDPTSGLVVNFMLDLVCMVERLYYNKKMLAFDVKYFMTHVFFLCWIVFIAATFLPYLFYIYITENILIMLPISVFCSTMSILFVGLKQEDRIKYKGMLVEKIRKIVKI